MRPPVRIVDPGTSGAEDIPREFLCFYGIGLKTTDARVGTNLPGAPETAADGAVNPGHQWEDLPSPRGGRTL